MRRWSAAGLTAFYSWRLIYKTFHGAPHDRHHYEAAHESPLVVLIPLGVLAVGSIAGGLRVQGVFSPATTSRNSSASSLKQAASIIDAMHHAPAWWRWLPTVMMALGWGVAAYFYLRRPDIPDSSRASTACCTASCSTSGTSTRSTTTLFVRPALWLGRVLWRGGDGWVIDGFGPDGVSARVLDVTRNVVRLQTGYLYHYAFAMLIGAAALITWFMFAGGGAH